MADKGIIFSAPMVRALIDGRKSQTRRVLKPKGGLWTGHGYPRILDDTPCKFRPGDRLYVREAFCPRLGYPAPIAKPHYRADDDKPEWRGLWRPSIHMPRWASRLTLTVTDALVQRLNEISAADSIAEGVECETCTAMGQSACHGKGCFASLAAFRALWNSLHGADAWAENPWVCAISFTVQHGNIDAVQP